MGWILAKKWSVLKQYLDCLHPIFIFNFIMIFIEAEKRRLAVCWLWGWIHEVLLVGCKVVLYHLHTASFTSTQWGQMMLKRPLRRSRREDWCKLWGALGIFHRVQ